MSGTAATKPGRARERRAEELAGVQFDRLSASPPPPDWMRDPHALAEWHRLAPILVAQSLLTSASLGAFAQMCALHGRIVAGYSVGEAPRASLMGVYRGLCLDFGLVPAAWSKVRPMTDAPSPGGNPFSRLRR